MNVMGDATYRPADIVRWLEVGQTAGVPTPVRLPIPATVTKEEWSNRVRTVVESALTAGKGALDQVQRKHVEETAYILLADALEYNGLTKTKRIPYTKVKAIRDLGSERFRIDHEGGSLEIKPVAHLVSGRIRVPIGWIRNGTEVPYSLLIEELAARCGVEIEAV